ncbi:MAG: helix-turn-helix domain-containing protein [Desulforhopalus sp.]
MKPISTPDKTPVRLCERVKSLRKAQGFTLDELSALAKVSRSMLSQIERGQANPTLAVTCRIAEAFAVSIGDLVDEPWVSSFIQIIHSDDPAQIYRQDDQCHIRTLSPLNMEKSVEFYEIRLKAGGILKSPPHFMGTKELFTLAKGEILVVSESEERTLTVNDSAHYRADVNHALHNNGTSEAIGYMVVTYP